MTLRTSTCLPSPSSSPMFSSPHSQWSCVWGLWGRQILSMQGMGHPPVTAWMQLVWMSPKEYTHVPLCVHAFVGAGPLWVLVPMCIHIPVCTGVCPRVRECPHGHACPRGPQACLQCIFHTCLQLLVSLFNYGWWEPLPCMEVKRRFF